MKKLISILSAVLILFSFPMISFAEDVEIAEYINGYVEYYDDGSYSITTIETSTISTLAASTVKQSKTTSHYNDDNDKEWDITVTGTFSFTGKSATCTNSTVSYKIYNNKWKVTDATASKSGAKAIGDFTLKYYFIGVVPTKTVEKTLTITCSNTGVCS